ncbi:aspartate kinase [Clostridium tetanomorphum]|uniref:Aspartokinase n=1 Tax=Clostridium tetanomorphum TaxID=1553 RepID=A0A923E8V9_CLOTT|nr:aspartate kinase [Clostridium tetanomorphum]KAJ51883.1 aspartate kinase LysC [Clostridium tetanomorphum DSM 665]MBC2398610.1 aspartate kinase [Clostridium tetanomorphum]MBP1864113.1 aspartate kinase [Clostridium tetanomorphum]NRS84526.1 aspartate kinase [Clostridium tetanomorphum]NRZ97740.1 aspartate kinase [Clostridium tetanomorphum]
MSIIVQKYGGSSVATVDKIKAIAEKVVDRKKNGHDMVVVVSAMGKTTDKLISMAKEISLNPNKRELDMLMSTGEQISIALLSMAFEELGYPSVSLTGFQAGIKTEGIHTKNRISEIHIDNVKKHLDENKIVVVAGFQGINETGDITTLGRGGSDTTAVALAAKLNCTCEIYTDVDGIYGIDPRIYPNAKKLDFISYQEMMEMASLGAGVMETRAVELGYKYNIPIYVASSYEEKLGTYIKEYDKTMEEKLITGLTISDDVLMVTVNNVPCGAKNIAVIFEKLAKHNVNIDMISQTAPLDGKINVSFTASMEDIFTIDDIAKELEEEINGIEISKASNITKISVVGIGMMKQSGVAAKVFSIFSDNNIEFKQVTTSEISISYTIDAEDKQKAATILAKELNL